MARNKTSIYLSLPEQESDTFSTIRPSTTSGQTEGSPHTLHSTPHDNNNRNKTTWAPRRFVLDTQTSQTQRNFCNLDHIHTHNAARQDVRSPGHGHGRLRRTDRLRHLPGWLRVHRHRLLRRCWSDLRHHSCPCGPGCHRRLQLCVRHLPGGLCCCCPGAHPLISTHGSPTTEGHPRLTGEHGD